MIRFFFLLLTVCALPAHSQNLLTYKSTTGQTKTVTTPEDWEIKRTQILEGMQQAMGKLPNQADVSTLDIQTTDSLKAETYTRYTISFAVTENERVPAYLYIPAQAINNKKLPAMVALHGTGDLGKKIVDGQGPLANRAYAKELAQRGYVVIAPDYPSMGDLADYNFDTDRYESATMKGIVNHMRCIDVLQSRAEVDPERIGVIGHSLGGHNAMFVGAFDTRLKVVVASCGWTLFDFYDIGEEASKRYGGRLGPWAQDRYMPLLREKYNLDGEQFPFDFDEVMAAIAPRAFFSNSPVGDSNFDYKGVEKGIASTAEVYQFFDAEENLQVRYPDAEHDFPTEVRLEAYQFIDKILNYTPTQTEINE